ncbi:hypothetical protein VTN00DRAFT_5933 [Thermoascus crustaceus]|uniref:uncharacterized protein n=1 Tax=Thermoascus crustaceus TaxID=5088 RepID=UPI0037429C07
MDVFSADIRRSAFEKLAALAVKSPAQDGESDIGRLTDLYQRPRSQSNGILDGVVKGAVPTSRLPMSIRELDVLLALCKASSSVFRSDHAARLVSQLCECLPESHSQLFRPSPFLRDIKPSPSEALTHHLTVALLSLGSNYPSLREPVANSVFEYLKQCADAVHAVTPLQAQGSQSDDHGDLRDYEEIMSITVSLVGFLGASAMNARFWTAGETLEIVKQVREIMSEEFMVAVETASSTIRNSNTSEYALREWRRYARRYAAHGRPLGAMLLQQGLMQFIKACTVSIVVSAQNISDDKLLDNYMSGAGIVKTDDDTERALIGYLADIITDEIHLLEDGSDYLQLGSSWQQRLAFSVKASAIIGFLNCVILDEDSADDDVLLSWLEDTLADQSQMASTELAAVTLKSMAIIARVSPSTASNISRSLFRFIVQGGATGSIVAVAARCLAQVLSILSQDAIITTLYSLGNVLSPGPSTDRPHQNPSAPAGETANFAPYPQPANGSLISLSLNGDEETTVTHRNVVHAIVTISTSCNDDKINALAQSMLLQKIGKINAVVDACIIQETAVLALSSGQTDFQVLLKYYSRLYREGLAKGCNVVPDAVQNARAYLSVNLDRSSPLHRIYLVHLLESIVNKGDATDIEHDRQKEVVLSADDIRPLLKPLALLVSSKRQATANRPRVPDYDEDVLSLFRDAWFNIAIHGISLSSKVGQSHSHELRVLAEHSPPLVPENRAEVLESDVELNTILRRGMAPHRVTEQKKTLIGELPNRESDIKRLTYPKAVFLNAALLIESLRASSGDCTKILTYFLDPALNAPEVGSCMNAIADKVVNIYLTKTLSGKYEDFSAPYLSKQLAEIFIACCHRIERVQEAAIALANKIISESPSALCERHSLFTLLELLTVMWLSCLEGELDEFAWKSTFTSSRGIVKVDLSDNYDFRKRTLDSFYRRASGWVTTVMNLAPLDVKGLLQTYLSEYEDDGAYGHVSMGRSFALEMGSLIPQSDQRLGSIDSHAGDIVNVASDFIAQYTTRQEYRFSEAPPVNGRDRTISGEHARKISATAFNLSEAVKDVETTLARLYERTSVKADVSTGELREALRKAAALLCSSHDTQPSIIHYLVAIPFQVFTKESIKLGISLWLGVIHENPRTEPRILVEVAEAWERTIQRKKGVFDPSFDHLDPLFTKIELLPTDKSLLLKKQQKAHNIVSPHFRILQFFESHFNAIRLGCIHTQRVFSRLISATLVGLQDTKGHPLAREIHFRIILFGLSVLKYSAIQSSTAQWKLKDQLLSAALSWFKHPPRWSFGGNRLQMKAEDKILSDVASALESITSIGVSNSGPHKSLQAKQSLVQILLENERSRLRVWLYPLEQERRHYITSSGSRNHTEEIFSLLRLAWGESAGLAIQLAARFPSPKLKNDVRWLLLNFPEKALGESASLEIMFGPALPPDVTFQLKYLLYWAPVNPIEALTYFLPAYGNHPFILQYAMRALESHSVDVRFFFVPQLVQALRYDALGYVERYILETAKLSQLFAHQVIWNMKANAYKDEDSQIPDPVKPTLDRFMDILISSFSNEERDFYEREFSFFNEITGVSGKLRPYIKKSKPEKKQKIEEELRKIKVEVGVYLPSNPDGVVVGIDRKSGKPLQSHAKAPYMATFRIRKTKSQTEADEVTDDHAADPSKTGDGSTDSVVPATSDQGQETYEVWQSAIFKVGDDCRQDVLALQMIAAFRSIFASVGLDVWVFPYRVTATAPGCGVIDVLPNSISRDMLGREAVNGLYDYFVSKYGGEDSTRFQEARTNFVKSMAAYSVISYLLQFKDRHNGNIMVDDAGHIIHIDFGFCFDIAPGGVRFERAPFKLTSEMVAVMGGGQAAHQGGHSPVNTQPYRWFESLVVKAFLASRPYSAKLSHIVSLMLDSGLPCFKPETLKNFRDRFVLEKSEREAAEYMRELIRKSYASFSTKGYDQFQLLTNGIPY